MESVPEKQPLNSSSKDESLIANRQSLLAEQKKNDASPSSSPFADQLLMRPEEAEDFTAATSRLQSQTTRDALQVHFQLVNDRLTQLEAKMDHLQATGVVQDPGKAFTNQELMELFVKGFFSGLGSATATVCFAYVFYKICPSTTCTGRSSEKCSQKK